MLLQAPASSKVLVGSPSQEQENPEGVLESFLGQTQRAQGGIERDKLNEAKGLLLNCWVRVRQSWTIADKYLKPPFAKPPFRLSGSSLFCFTCEIVVYFLAYQEGTLPLMHGHPTTTTSLSCCLFSLVVL